jgi:hypothetical protein
MTISDRFFGRSQEDPMLNDRVVPPEVLAILEAVEKRDAGLLYEKDEDDRQYESAEIYAEDLVPRNASFGNDRVNIIPGNIPGACFETLVVGIGEGDSCEKRILQALAHCATTCRNRTRFIIFNAAIWDGRPWVEHKIAFKALREDTGVMVIRRMLGEKAYTILV